MYSPTLVKENITYGNQSSLAGDSAFGSIKIFGTDFKLLLALLLLSFLVSYFTPKILTQVFFLGTLVAFFRSSKSYFWLAYFIVLFSAPFGLFSESQRAIQTGIPLFTVLPGISLNYFQLFALVALIKSTQVKIKYRYFVSKSLIMLFAYFGFLLALAILFHRASLMPILYDIRGMLYYTFLFSLPRLIGNKEKFYRFLHLLIPFITLHFVDSIYYSLNNGRYLVLGFDRNERMEEKITGMVYRFILMGGMFNYLFLTFLVSMLLFNLSKKQAFYKSMFMGMAFFVIVAGGFRSWFVIFSIILATHLASVKNKFSVLFYGVAFIIIVSGIFGSNFANNPVGLAFERATGVFKIFERDSDASASLQWKTEGRLPRQLELIRQSPITGWGFTENKGDHDVGNFGMLVDMGFLGFAVYVILWISIIRMFLRVINNRMILNEYRIGAKVLLAGFVGLLISHFTTNQIFGISTFTILISFFLFISDFFMKEALSTNNKS